MCSKRSKIILSMTNRYVLHLRRDDIGNLPGLIKLGAAGFAPRLIFDGKS